MCNDLDAGQDGSWRVPARLRKPVRLWTASGLRKPPRALITLAGTITIRRLGPNAKGNTHSSRAATTRKGGPMSPREERGLVIAATCRLNRSDDGTWLVPSQTQGET